MCYEHLGYDRFVGYIFRTIKVVKKTQMTLLQNFANSRKPIILTYINIKFLIK